MSENSIFEIEAKFSTMRIILLISALIFSQFSQAQEMIFLLNGGILEGKVKGVEDGLLYFEIEKGKKKKLKSTDVGRVFSVVKSDGSEEIYYEKDLDSGFFFEKEQMKHFVFGAQDAVKYYKGNMHTWVAGISGAVGGVLLYNNFLILVAPFGATLIGSLGKAHPRKSMVRDEKYLNDPAYVLGFERTAQSRKIMRSLLGATVGTVVGLGIGTAVDWNPR